jgi:hypothetical protein
MDLMEFKKPNIYINIFCFLNKIGNEIFTARTIIMFICDQHNINFYEINPGCKYTIFTRINTILKAFTERKILEKTTTKTPLNTIVYKYKKII